MARMRTLKPGFFTNDLLCEIPPLGRIFFEGLWCNADREGRLSDRPKKLKVEILPYDKADAEEFLAALATRGFLIRYQVNGQRYIQIVNFLLHQNPHYKEPPSTIPPPPGHEDATKPPPLADAPPMNGGSSTDDSASIPGIDRAGHESWAMGHESLGVGHEIHDPGDAATGEPEQGGAPPAQEQADPPRAILKADPDAFETRFWPFYPRRRVGKAPAKTAYAKKLKGGVSVEVLERAAQNFATYHERRGTDDEFIPYAATFLNDGRWQDFRDGVPQEAVRSNGRQSSGGGRAPKSWDTLKAVHDRRVAAEATT